MAKKTTIFLLWAATLIAVIKGNSQSEGVLVHEQPIDDAGIYQKPQNRNTPEVVLQLKYDKGALDRIYLAQFRQGSGVWTPSVIARTNLCSDLCHSGLGGQGCGMMCQDLVPIGIKLTLEQGQNSSEHLGEPRTSVCPTLCANALGEPLCNCQDTLGDVGSPDWAAICSAFCEADRFILGGCPACESSTDTNVMLKNQRSLGTADGWANWCTAQCRQGQGGAACNCDRTPFQ